MQNQPSAATLFSTLLSHMRPDAMEAVLESLLDTHLDETQGGVARPEAPPSTGVVMADFVELLVDEGPLGALAREVQGALIDNTGDVFDPAQARNVPDLDGTERHPGAEINERLDQISSEGDVRNAAEYISAENVEKLQRLAELTAL